MARSIYITQAEAVTGKSVVALGLLEQLSRQVGTVGIYRPVARYSDQEDFVVDLLIEREGADITAEQAIGVTYEQIHEDPDAALAEIVTRYHQVEKRCDFVVIVGTDYTDVATASELAFNAKIAANLGAPVLLVLRGGTDREPDDIRQLAEVCIAELTANHAETIAVVANRCEPADVPQIQQALATTGLPAFAIPHDPLLVAPSMRSIKRCLDAEQIGGDPELLAREVQQIIVGAMTLEHLLERITEGALVITPGDRSEILLGLVMAHAANTFPSLAGVVLSGGFLPAEPIKQLIEGVGQRLPILSTQLDTYPAVRSAGSVRGQLRREAQRKIDVALALFDRHVDAQIIADTIALPRPTAVTPLMFEYELLERARSDRKHIVLPEGNDDRILRAASTLLQRGIADLTILGLPDEVRLRAAELGLDLDAAQIIDPATSDLREQFAVEYARLRAHKGMTVEEARDTVLDPSYFGTMMVHMDVADGMVSGATHTTAHTIKPSFETIKTEPGISLVSSVFLMCLADRVLVYGDCAVNPDPNAEQLADIAISSAATAAQFGIDQRIAMLSYSTGDSGTGADVDKVRDATHFVKERRPDLSVEGPIQYDAAVDASVAQTKLPDSDVAGKATVFIFPDLNTGNNTYKAVQRSAGAVAIGPVLQGLNKPVNDLSRGALIPDIINTVAITAIQAQAKAAKTAEPSA